MNVEKQRILKLVEEGKITSSEALTLLELLEEEQKNKDSKEKEIISDLSTVVTLDEEEQKQQNEEKYTEKKVASAKDMILDFMDNLVAKVKDMDLNFTKSSDVTHIFQDLNKDFKDISIEAANGNVELHVWDEESVKVEVEAKVYRTDQAEEARKWLLEEIHFDVKDDKLIYTVGQKWMKVDSKMFIPRNQFDKVRIRLFNGAIVADDLMFGKLNVKTANGKISLSNMTGGSIDAETANGGIELANLNVEKLECETINGAVTALGSFEQAEVETFNGHIQLKGFGEDAQSIRAKSTSGAITITLPAGAGAKGEISANLGGLHVEVPGMRILDEKKEVIQKVIKFDHESETGIQIYADSKTGSVSVLQDK
ncbi:MAG: DUF4097 family beta strand repeat-containing protein [Bacillus sp. (in: firmicutes)]